MPLEDGTGVCSEGRRATEHSTLHLQQGFIAQNAADFSVTVWQSHLIGLNFFKTSSQAGRRPWFVQPLRIDHSKIFMNNLFEFPVDYLWKKPWLNDKIYDRESAKMRRVLGFVTNSWLNNSADQREKSVLSALSFNCHSCHLDNCIFVSLHFVSSALTFQIDAAVPVSSWLLPVSRCFYRSFWASRMTD